jgi:serine/threonine-protein kinase
MAGHVEDCVEHDRAASMEITAAGHFPTFELAETEAPAPQQLGPCFLRERVGCGGMGEVFRAEHPSHRQPCVIKRIRPELAEDPLSHTRFECEIQALATLRNPHIVKMLEHGRAADGTPYYIMEHLPGMTLEDLVQQDGPLSPERVIHLLRQVCAALAEIHDRGFVHRDVKPSNILCCQRRGEHDVITLIDFGLVQGSLPAPHEGTQQPHDYPQAEECSDGPGRTVELTQKGTILGSPLYMSPEQAACRGPVDGRSDLYSLGVVGYYLLTGQPLFVRDTPLELLVCHVHEPVARPSTLREGVPLDLENIILRCLEKDPRRRFADARSLARALAQCSSARR